MTAGKPVPQRTCIACHQVMPKRGLVRLVRLPDGAIEIDLTGKKVGRGAYLCNNALCWEAGLKGGKLEHALKTNITAENRQKLTEYANSLRSEH